MTFTSLSDMTHPALTVLPWEHTDEDRQGVHGIASRVTEAGGGLPYRCRLGCYCDHNTGWCASDREAFDALVSHATETAPFVPPVIWPTDADIDAGEV